MAARLPKEGIAVGRKRVQTAMRERGLEGIHPGPNLSRRDLQHRIDPDLLRNVVPQYPHHVGGIDIT
jgi:putative transposase